MESYELLRILSDWNISNISYINTDIMVFRTQNHQASDIITTVYMGNSFFKVYSQGSLEVILSKCSSVAISNTERKA
jgi:hypothetical protein